MKEDKLKVLILEDVESDAELVKLQFEFMDFDPEFEITFKKEQYIKLLDSFDPDIILSDFNLPTFDGLKALKILREKDGVTPFIFVTGTLGEENAVEAIKTGATDFIPKERVEHLPAAIIKAFRERDERVIRLREESKYKALIENSSECTLIVNDDTSVKYVSPSIKKILGYKPEEFMEASIFTHFPQEEVGERMKVFKSALKEETKETITDECKMRTKSGKYIWVSAILSDQRKTDGIEGVVINFRDIEDRKAAEKEIRTSEMRFKALTHEGSDLISVVNANGEYTFVSGNHKRIIGYNTKDLIGKRPIDFVHPEDAFKVMQHLEKLKKKKRIKPTPFRFKDAKGKYHWVESMFTNMSDDELVAGVVINSRDVSEMVEKTNELVLSNERYELASKASGDHIYDWNLKTGETFRIGNSLKTLFGYTNEEAKAENFWETRVHPLDKERTYQKLKAHLKDKKKNKCEDEYRFLKADGEYAYVNDIGYILRDEKGHAVRMIGAVTDVTKRKNLERHQELMGIISKSMNGSESMSEVLSQIAHLISAFSKVSVVEFWTTSIDQTKLNRIASGVGDEAGKKFEKQTKEIIGFSKGEGIPGQTWIRKKAMDEFKLTHADFKRSKAASNVGLDVGISIPIPMEDEIIGIILLLGKSEKIRISEHQPILESIAKEMAPYLQRKMTEEELNRFFDLSPDVLCIAGMDGFYKKVNPAMCNMLGLSRDEILSKPIVDFVHPDDIEATIKELGSLSDGQVTWRFENRYLTKSGQYIWFSWKAIPVFEEGLIYAVARNVTEKRELEELLEKSQRQAKIGTWYYDLQSQKIEWTAIARDIYEVEGDYVPSVKDISRFFPAESFEELGEAYERALNQGKPWDEELIMITAKGNKRWVRMTGNAEFSDGECTRLYGSIQDIHELKSAEMEKISILESITDGFIGLNNDGTITHWNYMSEQLFEVAKEEALGAYMWKILDEKQNGKLKEEIAIAMKQQEVRELELFNKTKGMWLDITVFPKGDGLTVYLRDVSEKRQMQKQLIRAITETQEKERARFGRELHDGITQYLAVSKMNLSQFKSLLEAGNTKMNVLDKVIDYLQETIDESRNISHGLLSTTLQNQGLLEAIDEVCDNIRTNKKIEVEMLSDLPADLLLSKDIELNIYRVVQELMNNMVKYSDAAKATISCELSDDSFHLVMQDDGKGIPNLESNDFKKGAGLGNIEVRVKAMNGMFRMKNLKPGLLSEIFIPIKLDT